MRAALGAAQATSFVEAVIRDRQTDQTPLSFIEHARFVRRKRVEARRSTSTEMSVWSMDFRKHHGGVGRLEKSDSRQTRCSLVTEPRVR